MKIPPSINILSPKSIIELHGRSCKSSRALLPYLNPAHFPVMESDTGTFFLPAHTQPEAYIAAFSSYYNQSVYLRIKGGMKIISGQNTRS